MADLTITAAEVSALRDAIQEVLFWGSQSRDLGQNDEYRSHVSQLVNLIELHKKELDLWIRATGDYPVNLVATIRDHINRQRPRDSEDGWKLVRDLIDFQNGPLLAMERELRRSEDAKLNDSENHGIQKAKRLRVMGYFAKARFLAGTQQVHLDEFLQQMLQGESPDFNRRHCVNTSPLVEYVSYSMPGTDPEPLQAWQAAAINWFYGATLQSDVTLVATKANDFLQQIVNHSLEAENSPAGKFTRGLESTLDNLQGIPFDGERLLLKQYGELIDSLPRDEHDHLLSTEDRIAALVHEATQLLPSEFNGMDVAQRFPFVVRATKFHAQRQTAQAPPNETAEPAFVSTGKPSAKLPKSGGRPKRSPRRRNANADQLTPRQTEVYRLWGEFNGNAEAVGKRLNIRAATVREHVEVANRKLGKHAVKPKTRRNNSDASNDARESQI